MNDFPFKSVFGPMPTSMLPKLLPTSEAAVATKKGNGIFVFIAVVSIIALGGYLIHQANKREEERRKT